MPQYKVKINGREFDLEVKSTKEIICNGKKYAVDYAQLQEGMFSVLVDNKSYQVFLSRDDKKTIVTVNGDTYETLLEDERSLLWKKFIRTGEEPSGVSKIRAPMPGLVLKLEVGVGTEVRPGTGLVILEAMKMENEIKATSKGKVTEVLVKEGSSVEKGKVLLKIS